jgi:hypothetical protein
MNNPRDTKTMKTPMMKLGVAATCLAFASFATFTTLASAGTVMSKNDYQAGKKAIAAEAAAAKAKCKESVANAKDICMAEAKGRENIALAKLEESNQPSDKTRYDVLVAQANATHAVAREKCDDATGNAKDVCVKQAGATHNGALADAKAQRKIAEANKTANRKTADASGQAGKKIAAAQKDVAVEKREGQYQVAKEKCDSQAGDRKDACLKDAKASFGKS